MIIPTKYDGYRAGRRLYPMGGGGSETEQSAPGLGMFGSAYGTIDPAYAVRRLQSQSIPQSIPQNVQQTNMDLVNKAYGNIGRASIGTNPNQIDQGGYNYWMNQLNSGAIRPQDFAANFAGAAQIAQPETANMYQNQALSQIRGARPSGESPQFYQPAYQSQYNNYANPLTAGSVANYGTTQGPSAGYMAAMAPGGQGLDNYYQNLQRFGAQQSSQPYGMDYATFNPARKAMGASQSDLMAAYSYNPQQQQNYGGGYGGGFMPQMQTPFNPYTNQYQSPFSYQQPMQQMQQPMAQRTSSGPSQAIVGRSSQMRGTPSVMRRAEGGIASLLDNDE